MYICRSNATEKEGAAINSKKEKKNLKLIEKMNKIPDMKYSIAT